MNEKSFVLWFTGLSASGKTTLAMGVVEELLNMGKDVEHLDGDVVRSFFPNTGFSQEERNAHIERIGYTASLLEEHGVVVVASFISPHQESRDKVRAICSEFIEVFLATPLSVCEERDPKGLYKKAKLGEIKMFTGIDSPYEQPWFPEITIDTSEETVEESVDYIMEYLRQRKRV